MKKFSSLYIPIALFVAAAGLHAQVAVDKTSLTFSGQVGGPTTQQTINVTTASGFSGSIFFLAQIPANASWLKFPGNAQGTNGNTPAPLTVIADPTGLAAATYNTTLTITPSPGGTAVNIPVSFTVSAIGVNPTSLSFAYQTGGAIPQGQSIALTGPNTSFTAAASTTSGGNWLAVTPPSGAITGATTGGANGTGALTALLDQNILPNLAAGSYTGAITITPTGSGVTNAPVTVPVTLTVSTPPPVTISGSTIQLNYQLGSVSPSNQPQQTLTLSTSSTQAINYGFSATVGNNPSGRNWIIVSPSSGTIPASGSTQVTVSYDTTANLPAGTFTGKLTLFTPGATPAQQDINVNLLVSSSPLLSVPNAGLNFTYELNSGTIPAAQNIVAVSTNAATGATTGQMVVTSAASTTNGGSWLSVTPASGATGSASPFTVAVNPAGLTPGKYQGTVTFTGVGAGNGAQTVPVTLTVANDPSLVTNLNSLTFAQQVGQTLVASSQASQTITVSSSTGATLNYTATASTTPAGGSWLVVTGNSSANTNNSFTVSVVPGSLTAGTYTGAITITATNPATGNAAINSPLTIPVTLYLSANPVLVVTLPGNPPSQPILTAQVNGAAPAPQAVMLNSSNSTVPLTYNVTFTTNNGGNWLFTTPQSGTTSPGSNMVQIGALPGILSAGTYTGTVTITATNPGGAAVAGSPYNIPVTFNVTSGTLSLGSSSLQFTQTVGGSAPATQTVQVSSNGQPLNYTAVAATTGSVNWLSVSPGTGNTSSSGTLTIGVDGSKLTPGQYTGTITVTAPNAGGSPAIITVNLTVNAGTISASPTSLTFTQAQNGTTPPATQTINVTGSPTSLNYTVGVTTATGGNWLTATAGSSGTTGSTPGTVQVSANAGTLNVGQYTGTVTITSVGSSGSPINIPVTLNVVAPLPLTVTPSGAVSFNYVIGTTAPQAQQVQLTSTAATTFTATAKTSDNGNWLSVTPASGNVNTTPTNLAISVSPSGLAAGNYTGTITIASPNSATPTVLNVNLTVTSVPQPAIIGIRNAASGATGAISPGENIVIFGNGIGPLPLVGLTLTGGKVSTILGQTQVLFDGIPAPIVYASATQTSVMVPYEIAGRPTTNITVVYSGLTSTPLTYNVVTSQPGVYTQNLSGSGPGAIVNQDFSVNGPTKPAPVGSFVAIYMTGEGNTTPQSITGGVAPLDGTGLNKPLLPVTATVAGINAPVVYSGSAPGFVYGAAQVNVQIPAGVPSGPQPVMIFIGGTATQAGVTVQVQ